METQRQPTGLAKITDWVFFWRLTPPQTRRIITPMPQQRQAGLVARRKGVQPPLSGFFASTFMVYPFNGRALWGGFGCAGSFSRSTNPQGRAHPFSSGWRDSQSA